MILTNLITMAGNGKRFNEEGYQLPKPLIEVDGEPMIYRVIDSLPASEKWIFVVRQEHIEEYNIDKILKNKMPGAIIETDKDLMGGASIFCAEKYLEPDEDVLIAGCDNGVVFNKDRFEELKDEKYGCILWTFTRDPRISDSPELWGYAALARDDKTIEDISVKVPISADPYEDHAVTAIFHIRSAELLYKAIRLMVQKEIKTKGEFYLDNLPIALSQLGEKSIIFDVDLYVGWGTPKELHEFEKILHHYKFSSLERTGLAREQTELWKRYFGDVHVFKN
ncbi:MAG: NTP transferase domain-containing protein [Candidatus Woesearchaeota archaeon]